jgi:hypothetical protein
VYAGWRTLAKSQLAKNYCNVKHHCSMLAVGPNDNLLSCTPSVKYIVAFLILNHSLWHDVGAVFKGTEILLERVTDCLHCV